MTRRALGKDDINREEPDPIRENISIREAMRQARERTNRDRNRVKCRKYYRKRMGKNHPDIVAKDDTKEEGYEHGKITPNSGPA